MIGAHFYELTPTAIGHAFGRRKLAIEIVSLNKVGWAIKSSGPYKLPGLNGIIPDLFQRVGEMVIVLLTSEARAGLSLGRILRA